MADGIGNAWHIPKNGEPSDQPSMRSPLTAIEEGTAVTLFLGNQFQGPGVTGEQTQSGSAVLVRKAGDPTFTALPMQFHSAVENKQYFTAVIPAGTFRAGDIVQYYFRINYTDPATTFLHGDDRQSATTAAEATAQANPFSFAVRFPAVRPAGAGQADLTFDSGDLQLRVAVATGHVELAGPDLAGNALANVIALGPPAAEVNGRTFNFGQVLSSNNLPDGLEIDQELGPGKVRARLTFPTSGVLRYEVTDWNGPDPAQVSFAVAASAGEQVYGLGEKFNALSQRGKTVQIQTFDHPASKGDRSYKVAPWFVSTRGYGVHFDSTAESRFDLAATAADRFEVTSPSGRLLINVVYGPRLTDVVTRYTGLTGRPTLPPPWAFGPWISSDVWRSGGEVRYAVTKFRERKIPASAFVFDSPWSVAYNDFAFNMTQFGAGGKFEGESFNGFTSLHEMMAFFQQNGLKVVCWLTPLVNVSSKDGDRRDNGVQGQNLGKASNYDAGDAGGFFVKRGPGGPSLVIGWWKGKGSHVDFTNPAARTWFLGQLQDLRRQSEVVTKSGAEETAIGGFKTDDGEGRTDITSPDAAGGIYIPDDAAFQDGRTGREMRNGYCVEYHKAVASVVAGDGLIFARSGFTGTQAFPGCWAGDNQSNFQAADGLPSVIVAGLSAAMSGNAIWGHDIGGYLGNFEPPPGDIDLFMRWAQFGCFTPLMQMHRQVKRDQDDPHHLDLKQYPWGYPGAGQSTDQNEALDNYRKFAVLHTQLFPYIYTYAQRAVDTGLPIIRPLVLIDLDDPATHTVDHTYHFGDELLVAPVLATGNNPRSLYLPQGDWIDFWDNSRHPGRQLTTWTNPDRKTLPLYMRAGAIVPMLQGDVESLCDANYVNNAGVKTWDGGLRFRIHPEGTSRFAMFDGTDIQCQATSASTTVTVASTARAVQLSVIGPRPAGGVRRHGNVLAEAASAAAFATAATAWRHDPATGFLDIKFSHSGGATSVIF